MCIRDSLDTKIKSPTNKFGFIEPEGILNGSTMKDRITNAINIAKDIDLILLKKLFFDFIRINYYVCNSIIFFIAKR